MVKIFIAGANGFIGYPAAQALARAGHHVYGLTRNMDVAQRFQENEITPVLGDAMSPCGWIHKVGDMDIVIDAVGGENKASACSTLYTSFHQVARSHRPHGPSLIYIYTSGAWIHGDDKESIFNDSSPLTVGIPLTAWRIPHERHVTNTKTPFIQGIVVRPALVYGRGCSNVGKYLFENARPGFVQWYGQPGGRVGTVHQDDLADLLVKVVEKAPILGGLSFIGVNPESESWDFILAELCKIVGARDVVYLPPDDPLQFALTTSQRFNASSARDLLGWTPKKRSLTDGLAEYYAAWEASEGKVTVIGLQ
ncbi:NAD-P-binding protein [Ramaria rubella]|nr:NAD-P-binding protein [Ramaria rubella]